MKKQLLCLFLLTASISTAFTQLLPPISNNTSYEWGIPLGTSKIILRSNITNTLWAYDISGGTFIELNSTTIVQPDYSFGFYNGKFYFAGQDGAGIELWVTDGTPGGTSMVKDINPGAGDSNPAYGFITYNNELYFTAIDGSGRELWKTNGTLAGTMLVKDINTGPSSAFSSNSSNEFAVVNGLLVFTATTAADGDELWATDGTLLGTNQVMNIYATASFGSYIADFTPYGSDIIFTAFDAVNGQGLWKTNGTPGGTSLIKDIDPTPPIPPPFYNLVPSIISGFFNFQNTIYFTGTDGATGYELWKTNGTTLGTVQVKDINPAGDGMPQLFLAVKNNSKFFFTATDGGSNTEIWESDGTGAGTQMLIDITGDASGSDPIILPNFFGGGALFQGDKFFFIANTPGVEGQEFYVSDGTASGTHILNDINPGPANGYDGTDLAWFYANDKFYFSADNGIDGSELWQSDGTSGTGTALLYDINPNAGQGSSLNTMIPVAGYLYFFGTNGDDLVATDYFRMAVNLALPLRWLSFEARPSNNDVLLLWQTAAEDLTDHFVVQRSSDGVNYKDIGQVAANGTGSNSYSFTDAGAMKLAVKKWYYRIKDVDKDNKSALSRVATVALNKSIASVLILPNPVVNELRLVIQAATNDQATIRVINMKGQVVMEKTTAIVRGKNTVTTDASGLSNGVYMLQITTGESSTTERFMIQH